jgi:ribonucleotide monophosphatase NagD (HAD superfamily)
MTALNRANYLNNLIGTDMINKNNIVQAHTPMREIYHQQKEEPGLVVIGGNDEKTYEVCEEFEFDKFITVSEIVALMPEITPLSTKSGYPPNKD